MRMPAAPEAAARHLPRRILDNRSGGGRRVSGRRAARAGAWQGATRREFSDRKLGAPSRNRGVPPSQPTASEIASRIIGQSPGFEKLIFPNTFTAQAEAIRG